ncbi:MAG: hypothetical protein IPK16_10710 [Anaerolineales bacterium]|nr:hypothetical protein [Anaerolineales bacterium]
MEQLLVADMAMKTGADQDTGIAVLIAELTQKNSQVRHPPPPDFRPSTCC